MRRRFLALMDVLAFVIVIGALAPAHVAAQAQSYAPKATATTWTPPSTAWGEPDLQGTWSNVVVTPLERPRELAGRQVLTDDEVAELQEQIAQRQIDRAPTEGSPGTYNRFWVPPGATSRQTSLVVDPPDGRLPPMTPEGQKRADALAAARQRPATGPEDRSVWERCIAGPGGAPTRFPGGYNNNFQILQIPGYVVILVEMVHDVRIIPLDGRPHIGQNVRQWLGDSRGHWEGNTLVVDVTNFSHPANFRGSGERLHLVERFTRVDADTIKYQVTVDEPTTFTKPWTAEFPVTRSQDRIFEYACHEGNHGMVGILAGARAQEKAAEEIARKGSR